jgi:hypothetical protein
VGGGRRCVTRRRRRGSGVRPTCTSYIELEYRRSPCSACGSPYSNARSNIAGLLAPHETREKNSARPLLHGARCRLSPSGMHGHGQRQVRLSALSHDLNRWLQLLRSETAHAQEIEEEEIEPYLLSFFILALEVDCFYAYSCLALRGGLHLVIIMPVLRNCKIL